MKRMLKCLCVLMSSVLVSLGTVTIDPTSRTFTKDGGGGAILTSGSGTWTATTTAPWITITPRTSGEAGVSCVYVVNSNFSADIRTGTILIGDNTFTVTQTGYSATLSPMTATFGQEGGTGSVQIAINAGVTWSAVANVDWLHVQTASGMSSGRLSYTVDPCGAVASRTGSMTIAGKTFMVTQTGVDVVVTPKYLDIASGATVLELGVTALATTRWTVSTSAGWVSLVDGGNGFGDSSVFIGVASNPSAESRTATVTIGSNTVTIRQKGTAAFNLDLLPKQATADATGAYGTIAVMATPDMPWTAMSRAPWITLATDPNGVGNGNVGYVASANPTLSPRTGEVEITANTPYPYGDLFWGFSGQVGADGERIVSASVAEYPVGRTESYSVQLSQVNALHRLFDLSGKSCWINTDNKLVVGNSANATVCDFSFAQNQPYEVYVVRESAPAPSTKIYARRSVMGEVPVLLWTDAMWHDCSNIGGSTYPSVGVLVHGTIASAGVWSRALSDYDIVRLSDFVSESPASFEGIYAKRYSFAPLENASVIYADAVHQGRYLKDLEGHGLVGVDQTKWSTNLTFHGDSLLNEFSRTRGKRTSFSSNSSYTYERNAEINSHYFPISTNQTYSFWYYGPNNNSKIDLNHYGYWFSLYKSELTDLTVTIDSGKILSQGEPVMYEMNDRRWHMVHLVYRNQKMDVYVDGSLQRGGISVPKVVYYIEDEFDISCSAGAKIDDFSVYNSALNAADVRGMYENWQAQYVGANRLGIPQTALASNPNSSLRGGMSRSQGHRGTVSYWYNSDDKNGYANVASICTNSVETTFRPYTTSTAKTYSFWYCGTKPASLFDLRLYGWFYQYDGFGSGDSTYALVSRFAYRGVVTNNDVKVVSGKIESNGKTIQAELNDSRWHMVTLVYYDTERLEAFVDGESVGVIQQPLKRNVNWFLDDEWDLDCQSGGQVDDFSIFNEALSAVEIQAIYEEERPMRVTHTVTQGVVEPMVSSNALHFAAEGGSGSVSVTVAQNVGWSVENSADWILLLTDVSQTGSRTVLFDVAPNPTVATRTATLTLAGNEVTVTQEGLTASLAYEDLTFEVDGGLAFIDVSSEGNALWTAASNVPWLTIVAGDTGMGNGSVMVVADPYTSTSQSRTGTLTVAGQTVYITQRGYTLSIFPQVAQIGSNSGAGEIGVAAPLDVVWEAIVTQPWITILGSHNGVGNGTLRYTVAENTTGATRTGRILVSGETYTITQISSLLVTTETDGHGAVTGGGAYETNEDATLLATPHAGYVFSHWSGDMVGYSNPVTFKVDIGKVVKANFIPEEAALTIRSASSLEQGLYTREQMRDLALGKTMIQSDRNGDFNLSIGLEECSSLLERDWAQVEVDARSVTVTPDGRVNFKIHPTGDTAFYRMVNKSDSENEEE